MSGGGIIISGWLMKKKKPQSGPKSMLSSKYQKRWFELTAAHLAYARDPNELNQDGIELFHMAGLSSVQRVEDTRIEMRFTERLLRVKANSPSEAARWHAAIEKKLYESQAALEESGPLSRHQPAPVKKTPIVTAFTIEADSDSDEDNSPQHYNSRQVQGRNQQQQKQQQQQEDIRVTPRAIVRPPPLLQPESPCGSHQETQHSTKYPDNRPPSPRSLLANPRMGESLIATPSRRKPSEDMQRDEAKDWDRHGNQTSTQHSDEHSDPDSKTVQLGDEEQDSPPRGKGLGASLPMPRPGGRAGGVPRPCVLGGSLPRPAPIKTTEQSQRPASLNSSLRSNVIIQDEVNPTLRSGNSSPCMTPHSNASGGRIFLNSPSRSPMYTETNNATYVHGLPGTSSLPPTVAARSDTLTLEPLYSEAGQLSSMPSGQSLNHTHPPLHPRTLLPATHGDSRNQSSRPNSAASSRFSTGPRLGMPVASRHATGGDDRLELAGTSQQSYPHSPATGGAMMRTGAHSRLGSAASSQMARAPSTQSSIGQIAPSQQDLQGTEGDAGWLEEDWDNAENGEGQDDDSAMAARGRSGNHAQDQAQPKPALVTPPQRQAQRSRMPIAQEQQQQPQAVSGGWGQPQMMSAPHSQGNHSNLSSAPKQTYSGDAALGKPPRRDLPISGTYRADSDEMQGARRQGGEASWGQQPVAAGADANWADDDFDS